LNTGEENKGRCGKFPREKGKPPGGNDSGKGGTRQKKGNVKMACKRGKVPPKEENSVLTLWGGRRQSNRFGGEKKSQSSSLRNVQIKKESNRKHDTKNGGFVTEKKKTVENLREPKIFCTKNFILKVKGGGKNALGAAVRCKKKTN